MLIVCAGRSRSGSTLLYNLVRLTLIELFGKLNVYGRGVRNYRRSDELKYNIVKLHDSGNNYFYDDADYVFSSCRNEEDQKRSIIRFRKIMKDQKLSNKQLMKFMKYDYRRYKKWISHPKFVKTFEFNDLINSKNVIVEELCKILGYTITNDSIYDIIYKLDNIKLPSKNRKKDPETCLTWHHFTGGIK